MAQEPFDSLTPQSRRQLAQGEADTSAIKRNIERTRNEMGETLGEIEYRLRPDYVMQQAKDSVRKAAAGKVRNIMQTAGETAQAVADQTQRGANQVARYIRNHPVETALVAAGITWWLMRDRVSRWEYRPDYSPQYDDDTRGSGGTVQGMRETVSEYADQARDSARQYAGKARDTARQYADQARESARNVAASVRSAANTASVKAQDGWCHAADTADRVMRENPLAVGAAAVAVGVAIGLSVPRTEYEDRTFGETRDNVLDRATEKAGEIRDRVVEKVQSAADVVTDTLNGPATHTTLGTTRT